MIIGAPRLVGNKKREAFIARANLAPTPPARVFDFTRLIDPAQGFRPYGPPAAWPAGRPATFQPVSLFATRYAVDAPLPQSSGVVALDASPPVRALGDDTFNFGTPDASAPSAQTGKWGVNHPMQKRFWDDTISLAKEQPWLTGLIVGMGGLAIIAITRALGKVEG